MYNLIMSGAEGNWDSPTDSFPKSRFLEHTVDSIAERFRKLDEGAITQLLAMPTLFAYERYVNGAARVGRLTRLQQYQNDLHITYAFDQQVPAISAAKLEEIAGDLDIGNKFEFSRTHWAVKDVDLASVLVSTGIVAAAPLPAQPRPPKVFISYSWDSAEHRQWVAELGAWLRTRGIDVTLDQWHLTYGEDLGHFMERSVREADRVLVICTESYAEKTRQRRGGVGYEHMILTGTLMQDMATTKIIPVVRQNREQPDLPAELQMRMHFNLSDGRDQPGHFEELARELHGIRVAIPPLGANPYI